MTNNPPRFFEDDIICANYDAAFAYTKNLAYIWYVEEFEGTDGWPSQWDVRQELADIYSNGDMGTIPYEMYHEFFLEYVNMLMDYWVKEIENEEKY